MTSTLLAEQSDSPLTPQRVLEDVFGYQEFRDGQQLVIDAAVEGRDLSLIHISEPTRQAESRMPSSA